MPAPNIAAKELRRVVIAAAVGNIIEWYDFYIFGSLAAILSVKFFEKSHPVAAFLSTVALFSIGFLIRPLGAFVFGWVGDKVGRKYTFLVTLSGMGLSTALIGVIPTYAKIGILAAILLFALRLIQGLCLGGEYGGAITYVAEHISDAKRGYYTGWLQTSPTLGIVVSLAVIIGTRSALGTEKFNDWGWRIPFIISLLLVMIAVYIRLSLQETPIFQDIKARGQTATNPWRQAFLSSKVKYAIAILIVAILVNYVGMTYGPIAAFLAEFFPGRIRYTSVSVPYHIGNGWGGGLVPIITTSAYLSTGSVGAALIYPIALPAVCFVLSLFLMPETNKISIWEPIHVSERKAEEARVAREAASRPA